MIAALLLALAAIVWQQRERFGAAFGSSLASEIDPNVYQAVFLTGGQVYFGRLTVRSDDLVLLTDVYYLSGITQEDPKGTLVKRGAELHGPREPMVILADQVLFIENQRPDSEVAQAIRRFKASETAAPTAPPAAPVTPTATPPAPTLSPTASPRSTP